MNLSLRRTPLRLTAVTLLLTGLVGGAAATLGIAVAPTTAGAATAPPWEPDPSSVGGLTFYNSAGDVITTGSTAAGGLGAFVEGGATIRSGDTKATLYAYTPVNGQPPSAFNGGTQLSASTTYPTTDATAPAAIKTSTLPVVTGPDGNTSLASYIASFPNTATGSYANLYQLRLKTTASGQPGNTTYDSADISVSGSTWTVVYPAPSTTPTVTASVAPTASVYGQSVSYSTTVNGNLGTAAGSVAFKVGSTTLCTVTLSAGAGSCSATNAPVGSDTVTATYTPSATYSSASGTTPLTVAQASTTSTLVSSVNPTVSGQSTIFTATVAPVSPGAGVPTGTVTFKDGSTTLGTGTLNGSSPDRATYSTSSLSVAASPHSVTAVYAGDTDFATSTSSPVSQAVDQASTTTTLGSTTASVYGQAVTFTATVAPVSPGTGVPTGTVTFKDGGSTLGTGTLNGSGVATYQTSALSVSGSPHSITAVYGATTNYAASTASAVSQVVNKSSTATALTAAPNPSATGSQVTFTATVTATAPGSGTPTGTVAFKDGGSTLGTGTLNGSGVATYRTSSLAAASHSVTAVYAGDANFATSTSPAVSQVVATAPGAPTGVTATAGNTSAAVGFTPGSNGGAPITSYAVTATDTTNSANGGQTATGPVSPITVTGLTNGDSYTFAVTATNSVDLTSPLSGSSSPVTPAPPAPPAAPAGSTSSEQATSSSASGTATASVPGGASATGNGAGSFTVAQYGGDPVGGAVSGTNAGFFDLAVAPGSLFSSVTLTVCAPDVTSLNWWNGSAWVPFSSQSASGGCVTATVTSSTSPSFGDLTGTPVVALTTPPAPPAANSGYDLVGSDGGVFVFPTGQSGGYYGSLPGLGVSVHDIVGMVPTADDQGYFLVGADGGVFAFGNAPFEGSLPGLGVSVHDIVGIVPSSDDNGYFLVGSDGGVFAFGDAIFEGSLPGAGISTSSVVGIASTPDNRGYWVVLSNGTVYNFGTAGAFGSATSPSPISGIAGTPDGNGYWLVAQNGSVYAYGDAQSYGSLPAIGVTPNKPVVGIVPTADQKGYWLIGADGGVFAFGDAPSVGSLPGLGLSVSNIVGAVPTQY